MEFLGIPSWFWTGKVLDSIWSASNRALTTFQAIISPISALKLHMKSLQVVQNKQIADEISRNSLVVLDRKSTRFFLIGLEQNSDHFSSGALSNFRAKITHEILQEIFQNKLISDGISGNFVVVLDRKST